MCSSKQGLPHKLAKLVVTLLNAVVVKVCPSFVFRLLHLRCWFVYRMVFLLVCIQQAGRVCGFSLAFSLVFCSTILLFFFSSNGTVFLVWFSSSSCCLFCFNRTVPYTTDCTCTGVPKGLRMKMVKRLSGGGGIHIRTTNRHDTVFIIEKAQHLPCSHFFTHAWFVGEHPFTLQR